MAKVAVITAWGCEESETAQTMDLLMRARLTCTSFATGRDERVRTRAGRDRQGRPPFHH